MSKKSLLQQKFHFMMLAAIALVSIRPALAQPIPVGSGNTGPAMVEFQGALYVAWADANTHVSYAVSNDGKTFGPTIVTRQLSFRAPALAVFDGQLYLAWTGTDSRQTLNIAQAGPDFLFSNAVQVNNYTSSNSPALAVFGSQLVIAWTGTDAHRHLNVASSFDGIHWGPTATLNQLSSSGPSLTVFQNQLYIGWSGTDSNAMLNYASSADGTHFGPASFVAGIGGGVGPGLATFVNFDVAFTTIHGDLNIAFSSDGVTFGTIGAVGQITNLSPAMTTFDKTPTTLLWIACTDNFGNVLAEPVP